MKRLKNDSMDEKNKYPRTFETSEYRFSHLFQDFIFWEFLRSGFKEGKPSEFLLDMSNLLHKSYKRKDMDIFEGKDTLETLDKIIRDKAEELSEVMKEMFPEGMKELESEKEKEHEERIEQGETRDLQLISKIDKLEKRIKEMEKKMK